ncbi:DUF6468 domain-containing protein [Acetobacter sp. LMG 32666]|uniref:DUF6468 domain-containing protein n=1 Tax=Acetobacter sp. LMG 32666 TaxID=2959295 RepID=UPI0030C83850
MMFTQIQMIIEITLSVFLFLGIIYSFYLGRVLGNLKRDRSSLLDLVNKLESSVNQAEEGVDKLRVAGEVSGRPLSRMIEQAKVTGTELDDMATKADSVADRLDAALTQVPSQERRMESLIEQAETARLAIEETLEKLQQASQSAQQTAQELVQSALESATAASSAAALAAEHAQQAPNTPPKTQFADTLDMPMPATLTKERPYLRALGKAQDAPPDRESA